MVNMPSTILVTGGAGFVGSHTSLVLLEKGHDLVIIDCCLNTNLAAGQTVPESVKRLEELSGKKLTYYYGDLYNKDTVREIFQKHKFDLVMHFAARKAVGESVGKPLEYYSNNLTGTLNLLEIMREFEVFKIIYSSSSTVYGPAQYLPIDEKHQTGIGCTNPYAKSKVFTEEILKDLAKVDKRFKIIILRYFNPIGAHKSGRIGEDPKGEPRNLLPYVAQVAVGRLKVLKVFGSDYNTPDGTPVRDYLHVMDCAQGHVKAMDYYDNNPDFCGYTVFNLGRGRNASVLEVIRAFEKATGKKIPYEIVGRREGDLEKVWASADRAKKELNWTATMTMEDACADMWNWQSKNPNGYVE